MADNKENLNSKEELNKRYGAQKEINSAKAKNKENAYIANKGNPNSDTPTSAHNRCGRGCCCNDDYDYEM